MVVLDMLNTLVEVPIWFLVVATLAGGVVGVLSLWLSLLVLRYKSSPMRFVGVERRRIPDSAKPSRTRPVRGTVREDTAPVQVASSLSSTTILGKAGVVTVGKARPSVVQSTPILGGTISKGAISAPATKERDTLSITEAAKQVGVVRSTMHRWIQESRVKADMIDGEWRISKKSLAGLRKES